jgi:hypothetical protein
VEIGDDKKADTHIRMTSVIAPLSRYLKAARPHWQRYRGDACLRMGLGGVQTQQGGPSLSLRASTSGVCRGPNTFYFISSYHVNRLEVPNKKNFRSTEDVDITLALPSQASTTGAGSELRIINTPSKAISYKKYSLNYQRHLDCRNNIRKGGAQA